MPISQSALFSAAASRTSKAHSRKRAGQPGAFLCHSDKDSKLAFGLQEMLKREGWDIYVDWRDPTMPETPDALTTSRIQNAIIRADWFLFLATENSILSRWCQWEIGYAEGRKQLERIAIVPTTDELGHYHGNEYLKLYNTIGNKPSGGLALYNMLGKGNRVSNL